MSTQLFINGKIGATVLPGFLDLHAHPSFTATLADAVPLPPDVDSLAALLERPHGQPGAPPPDDGDGAVSAVVRAAPPARARYPAAAG